MRQCLSEGKMLICLCSGMQFKIVLIMIQKPAKRKLNQKTQLMAVLKSFRDCELGNCTHLLHKFGNGI